MEDKTIWGILQLAFHMAMDNDVLHKNPFGLN